LKEQLQRLENLISLHNLMILGRSVVVDLLSSLPYMWDPLVTESNHLSFFFQLPQVVEADRRRAEAASNGATAGSSSVAAQ
jgi:hypothetical protein